MRWPVLASLAVILGSTAPAQAHNVSIPPDVVVFPMPTGTALGLICQPSKLGESVFLAFKDPIHVGGRSIELDIHTIATLDERPCVSGLSLSVANRDGALTGPWLPLLPGFAILGPHPARLRYVDGDYTPWRLYFRGEHCEDGPSWLPSFVCMILVPHVAG